MLAVKTELYYFIIYFLIYHDPGYQKNIQSQFK